MKSLRLLIFALTFTSALTAEQSMPIEGAPFELSVPDGWIRIPDKAMERFRQPTPGVQSNYVAGFAGPRPPPNTPMTILLVQIFPGEITPRTYIDHSHASLVATQTAHPEFGLVQDDFRVGMSDRAVITGLHGNDGRAGRTYAFPSSKGLIEFSLFCPTGNAPATFAAVESCLSKLRFTEGTELNTQWIAELKQSLPSGPKRVY